MINIVNGFKHGCFESENTIYIGRPGKGLKGSPLANPFKLTKESDRQSNLSLYKKWLWLNLKDNTPQLIELQRIMELERKYSDIYLACFCKPRDCHGDIILRAIRSGLYD